MSNPLAKHQYVPTPQINKKKVIATFIHQNFSLLRSIIFEMNCTISQVYTWLDCKSNIKSSWNQIPLVLHHFKRKKEKEKNHELIKKT